MGKLVKSVKIVILVSCGRQQQQCKISKVGKIGKISNVGAVGDGSELVQTIIRVKLIIKRGGQYCDKFFTIPYNTYNTYITL